MMPQKYVAYYRVSTKIQEYGIDAQANDVRSYVTRNHGDLIAEFSEKESGKKADRPQLIAAISKAKLDSATLIFSKLDRVSRDAAFIFTLKAELDKAGVRIVCVALPDLNTLTLGIFATIAQHERETIAARTKAGLAVARSKGKQLGGYRGPQKAETRDAINAGIKNSVKNRDSSVWPTISALGADGKTDQQIADFLNATGQKTYKGFKFSRQIVGIVRRRNEGET